MPKAEHITPVRLDGSFPQDTRFPYKTGDDIALCIFGGRADRQSGVVTNENGLWYFRPERVIANDAETGTMVVTFTQRDGTVELDTLDPTWSDTVIPWDADACEFPTLASHISEETWYKVEQMDVRVVGGKRVRAAEILYEDNSALEDNSPYNV